MSLFIENVLSIEATPEEMEVQTFDPEKRHKSKRLIIDGLANFLLHKTHAISAYND